MNFTDAVRSFWPDDKNIKDREFILLCLGSYYNNHSSTISPITGEKYPDPFTYIICSLAELAESGQMGDAVCRRIVAKLKSTLELGQTIWEKYA